MDGLRHGQRHSMGHLRRPSGNMTHIEHPSAHAPDMQAARGPNWKAPGHWLAMGWRDLRRHPFNGFFYGVAFWLMAHLLSLVFQHKPQYTLSMVSGCLLVGPFLAMGLYDVSRRHEQGLPQDFGRSLTCWSGHLKSMAMLVLVLLVLELLWGRASLVIFAVFFNTGLPSTTRVIDVVFSTGNFDFLLIYGTVGAGFAMLVYAFSVVSIPMILDRDTDAITASITSMGVFAGQWPLMLCWGIVLTGAVITAFLTPYMLGLIVVGPCLGHASWHAYRGTVVRALGEAPLASENRS